MYARIADRVEGDLDGAASLAKLPHRRFIMLVWRCERQRDPCSEIAAGYDTAKGLMRRHAVSVPPVECGDHGVQLISNSF
jgi:hypothetical protein